MISSKSGPRQLWKALTGRFALVQDEQQIGYGHERPTARCLCPDALVLAQAFSPQRHHSTTASIYFFLRPQCFWVSLLFVQRPLAHGRCLPWAISSSRSSLASWPLRRSALRGAAYDFSGCDWTFFVVIGGLSLALVLECPWGAIPLNSCVQEVCLRPTCSLGCFSAVVSSSGLPCC